MKRNPLLRSGAGPYKSPAISTFLFATRENHPQFWRPPVALRRLILFGLALLLAAALRFPPSVSAGDDWQPINPEDLKMTSIPEAPGAPAIYLFRQVDRDDQESREYSYLRIKILTEEGRKHADVEIPFFQDNGTIRSIKARTIRPDGSIAGFDGKVYEKTIVKAKGVKY